MNETTTPTPAPAFGKFASAEQLLKAYNSLEAEFTRRSRRLKELETESAKTDPPKEFTKDDPPKTDRPPASGSPPVPAIASGEPADAIGERERNLIIARYLESLSRNPPAPVLTGGGGGSALTAFKKPKTLEEAAAVSRRLLGE